MPGTFDPYYEWLGIPPKDQPPNHYRLLGLELLEDNPRVIENAADQRMAHLRTLQSGPRGRHSQELLNQLASARLTLLNSAAKADYDATLAPVADSAAPTPVTEPPPVIARQPLPPPPPVARDVAPEPPVVERLEFPRPSVVVSPAARTTRPRRRSGSRRTRLFWGLGAIAVVAATGAVIVSQFQANSDPMAKPSGNKPAAETLADGPDSRADGGKPADPASVSARSNSNPSQAPVTIAGQVDLLRLIDPVRDSILGPWRREAQALLSSAKPFRTIRIRFQPSSQTYVLRLTVRRRQGREGLMLGLVTNDRQFGVMLGSGDKGHTSGIHELDERAFSKNDTTTEAIVFRGGAPCQIECQVQSRRVRVLADGRAIIDWTGAPDRLSNPSSWRIPGEAGFYLGAHESQYLIEQMTWTPAP